MISLLNILNLLTVLTSFVFQVLLIREFGVAQDTDIYYLSTGIIQFTNWVFIGFLMDLYIPVYNEIKTKNEDEAKRFSGAIFSLMIIISLLISVLLYVFAPFIVQFFASGFDAYKISSSTNLVRVLSISVIFTSLTQVLNYTLNANLFMSTTYICNFFIPLFNLLAFLLFSKSYGILAVIYSLLIVSFVNFLYAMLFFSKKIGLKLSNPFYYETSNLLIQNIPFRIANIIYLLKAPITTNVLSYFPTGSITFYNYADRILSTLFNVTSQPLLQILYAMASSFFALQKIKELQDILLTIIVNTSILLICGIMPVLVLFKELFGFLLAPKVTSEEITVFYYMFLSLIPLYLLLSFEFPLVYITNVMKKGIKVLQISIIYIMSFTIFVLLGTKIFTGWIYIIPVALFLSQSFNTISYSSFINKKLVFFNSLLAKQYTKMILFIFLLLFLNLSIVLSKISISTMFLNTLLLILWIFIAGNEIIRAFKFIMKKGIIK